MTDQLHRVRDMLVLFCMLLPIHVGAQTPEETPHPGQKLIETYCTVCHNLDYVAMQPRLTSEQAQTLWTNTVRKMVQSYGAEIPDRLTERAIIDYLISQSELSSEHQHAGSGGSICMIVRKLSVFLIRGMARTRFPSRLKRLLPFFAVGRDD